MDEIKVKDRALGILGKEMSVQTGHELQKEALGEQRVQYREAEQQPASPEQEAPYAGGAGGAADQSGRPISTFTCFVSSWRSGCLSTGSSSRCSPPFHLRSADEPLILSFHAQRHPSPLLLFFCRCFFVVGILLASR